MDKEEAERMKAAFEELAEEAEAFMLAYAPEGGALIITRDEVRIVDCIAQRKLGGKE